MTAARKRRAPEKAAAHWSVALALHLSRATGRALAARPSLFGGLGTFAVVFSFVAANALWYQPPHPAPIFDTRAAYPSTAEGVDARGDTGEVTTFRIERQKNTPDEVQAAAAFPASSDMYDRIVQIQQQLANLGLYDGSVDGRMGSMTTNAIVAFQDRQGMTKDGLPSQDLLTRLLVTNGQAAIIPADRPNDDLTTNSTAGNTVAETIDTLTAEPAAVPQKTPRIAAKPLAQAAKQATAPKPVPPLDIPVAKKKVATKPAPVITKKGQPVAGKVPAKAQAKPAPVPAPAKTAAAPKPATIISMLASGKKPKPSAKPADIDTAEALPAEPRPKAASIDHAEALPAVPEKPVSKAVSPKAPVKTAPAKTVPAKTATVKTTPAKTTAAKTVPVKTAPVRQGNVLKIQQGLSQSYPGLAITGVAGPETKAAIRNFEKNYNMPVTGEPSEALVKKMKNLGLL